MSLMNIQLKDAYQGKTVLLTGHTGFKGSWLSEWLLILGARVVGIALTPDTQPSLFDQLGLAERVEHNILDIRESQALKDKVLETQPDFIFHLAAQPLVRRSYIEPVETWGTNVMGTVHLLEAMRELDQQYKQSKKTCASVFITTDKCYENRDWLHGYREEDPLGGFDPYSSSKAATELAIAAYRRSFFSVEAANQVPRIGIASARAGNVIGGGDWAQDRIIPDCIRSLAEEKPILIRNPNSTRPWQHVLDPLAGYLQLAVKQASALQASDISELKKYCDAYNFGPAVTSNQPVKKLVNEMLKTWPGEWYSDSDPSAPHEAGLLSLNWDKSYHQLGWVPKWGFEDAIGRAVGWYQDQIKRGEDALDLVRRDIIEFTEAQ